MTSGLKDKCSLHKWFSLYKCHSSNMCVYVLSQCLFSVLEYNNKQKRIVSVLRKYTLMTLASLQTQGCHKSESHKIKLWVAEFVKLTNLIILGNKIYSFLF